MSKEPAGFDVSLNIRMASGLDRIVAIWVLIPKKNTTSPITSALHNGALSGYSVIVEEEAQRPPSTSLLRMTLKSYFNSMTSFRRSIT